MCLLDAVARWDADRISCVSRTHRDPDNPMRAAGRLPALCGVEYAAQAMAVHGALTDALPGRPRAGYLASIRDVVCRVDRLDAGEGDLIVEAERLMGDDHHAVYRFSLRMQETELLSGRATVALDAGRSRP